MLEIEGQLLKAGAPSHVGPNERAARPDKYQDWAKFTVLVERHRTAVIHFLYRMIQEGAVAEELAEEAFFQLYRSGRSADPFVEPETRLFRIATDLALGALKNGKGQSPPDLLAGGIADAGRAVASMSAKQRAAVVMHKYHRMDYWQIATVLNCSESVARSLLFRAYEILRRRPAPYAAPQQRDLQLIE